MYGGIYNYGISKDIEGKFWDGKMYVFDECIVVDINKYEYVVVGRDYFINELCECYINCGNLECNK